MALTFPYALAFLSDCLQAPECELDLMRNDEYSQSGAGGIWASEMADPLWTAYLALYAKSEAKAREINAKVWALEGSNKTFLFNWVDYSGPAFGVTPALQAAKVLVNSVSADRTAISLKALPANYKVSVGDAITIVHNTNEVYYGHISEERAANASGVTTAFQVYPYLPPTVAVNNAVELVKPYFQAQVPGGGFKPFKLNRYGSGTGASIRVVQKP